MNGYLLDTNVILFALLKPERIPANILALIEPANRDVMVSAVSWYEVALKIEIGRLVLPTGYDFDRACDSLGATSLSVSSAHAHRAGLLPLTNRDPFDRIIVAQALEDGLELISSDRHMDGLGIERLW